MRRLKTTMQTFNAYKIVSQQGLMSVPTIFSLVYSWTYTYSCTSLSLGVHLLRDIRRRQFLSVQLFLDQKKIFHKYWFCRFIHSMILRMNDVDEFRKSMIYWPLLCGKFPKRENRCKTDFWFQVPTTVWKRRRRYPKRIEGTYAQPEVPLRAEIMDRIVRWPIAGEVERTPPQIRFASGTEIKLRLWAYAALWLEKTCSRTQMCKLVRCICPLLWTFSIPHHVWDIPRAISSPGSLYVFWPRLESGSNHGRVCLEVQADDLMEALAETSVRGIGIGAIRWTHATRCRPPGHIDRSGGIERRDRVLYLPDVVSRTVEEPDSLGTHPGEEWRARQHGSHLEAACLPATLGVFFAD